MAPPPSMESRTERLLFYLLFIAAVLLAGWTGQRHQQVWDWSDNADNSLSEVSATLLQKLQAPLEITCFAPQNPQLREQIAAFIQRYQRLQPGISLQFKDPARYPELTRELGIRVTGELRLEYQGRSENLRDIDEQSLSNAIQRLLLQGERWIFILEGHGERRLDRQANHDLGQFGVELLRKGYRLQPIDLSSQPRIPDNTGLLVLAGPKTDYLPGETRLISEYLEQGGNLLWLLDPDTLSKNLRPLAEQLALRLLPGTIVDASAAQLGLDDPAMALVLRYPDHPATRAMESLSLFPHAAALETVPGSGWQSQALLQTQDQSWNESGELQGELQRNSELGERAGPLTIGWALTRKESKGRQRVLVIGDGDFLSNSYLGNGGNLDLGLSLIRWLSQDDRLLDIPARHRGDTHLALDKTSGVLIALWFLLLAPLLLAGSGLLIWWRRRRS